MNLYEFLNQLNEEHIPWPENKARKLFDETVARLVANFNIDLSYLDIVDLQFQSTTIYGQCACGEDKTTGKFRQIIKINKRLQYDGLEDIFINNICHEFCHFILNCQMWEKGYFVKNGDSCERVFPSKEIEEAYIANAGHGKYFMELAKEVTQKMQLKYPITATVDKLCANIVDEVHGNYWTYALTCNTCGPKIKFYTEDFDNFFKDIMHLFNEDFFAAATFLMQIFNYTFENEPNNLCAEDNGNLGLVANNQDINSLERNFRSFTTHIVMQALFNM